MSLKFYQLSYWAFSDTYGVKGIAYKSPYYKISIVKYSTVLISFGKELDNFEIAGDNKIFYSAIIFRFFME